MTILFYIAALVAVIATVRAVTHTHVVHALLYFVASLFAVAFLFFLMGAPFVAALEVIIYAGAIVVLFLFAVMLLGVDAATLARKGLWQSRRSWVGPALLGAVLLVELGYVLSSSALGSAALGTGSVRTLSQALFGRYVLGVELSSMLLLAGLVGALHLGRRPVVPPRRDDHA